MKYYIIYLIQVNNNQFITNYATASFLLLPDSPFLASLITASLLLLPQAAAYNEGPYTLSGLSLDIKLT